MGSGALITIYLGCGRLTTVTRWYRYGHNVNIMYVYHEHLSVYANSLTSYFIYIHVCIQCM